MNVRGPAKSQPTVACGISKATRAFVFDRDGYTCQQRGAVAGEPHPHEAGRKTCLHVSPVIDKSPGGSDDASSLRTICSLCNEGAVKVAQQPADLTKLLVQVRRATAADQREVLRWLRAKFKE